jgi:pimeloyl-ACP methyl ester carboxylesterase
VLLNARPAADGSGWTWRHDSRNRPDVDRWRRIHDEMPKGWAHAAALRSPMLLLRGARSEIVLPRDVERFREVVDDLQVVEVDGAGHNIHGDQPRELGAALARFIAEGAPA